MHLRFVERRHAGWASPRHGQWRPSPILLPRFRIFRAARWNERIVPREGLLRGLHEIQLD